jgi:hypothetical protein
MMNKGDNLPGNSKIKIGKERHTYMETLRKTRSNALPVGGDVLSVKKRATGVIRE